MLESPYLPILFGAGAPAAALGIEGQMYCDTSAAYKPYVKHSGAWTALPTGGGTGAVTQIGQTVTAGSQTTVTFSGIAATYNMLMFSMWGRSQAAVNQDGVLLRFNSDAGANYNRQVFNYHAAISAPAETLGGTSAAIGPFTGTTGTASYLGSMVNFIPQYAATNLFKQVLGFGGNTFANTSGNTQGVNGYAQWLSTAAINRLDFTLNSGAAFVDGSVFTLWGIT